jgi:tetratricopeptide (TPR) repeat protein
MGFDFGARASILRKMVGDLVAGRFRVERLAASGGMGRVYRAHDERTDTPVALKVMTGAGSVASERFEREVELLARLRHAAVVRYVDHGSVENDRFLAMEWLDGHDLATRLKHGPLSVAETIALARRVAGALAFAHERGVLHRDLKPANIFLVGGDLPEAKLVDFGVSRAIGLRVDRTQGSDGPASATGVPVGTIGYMAPEQARGDRFLDARVDVFSLGCVVFECLAGRPPFVGEHPVAVLAKILLEEAPRLSAVAMQPVPGWLDALLADMLTRDPVRRPADGAALMRWFERRDDQPVSSVVTVAQGVNEAITAAEKRLTSIVAIGLRQECDASVEGVTAELRAVAERFGADLEPIVSGPLVAVLRGAGSAGDLAARAARCALAFRAAGPVARVALATGFEAGGELPTGGAIDRAFSQLDRDRQREDERISVDELTAGLIDNVLEVEVATDGRRWLRGPRQRTAVGRRLLGRLTPFVGREKDLALLLASLEETIAEPVANSVLVLGAAGIGKSRLRHELTRAALERHPGLEVWVAHGDSVRQGSSLSLIADAIAGAVGLRDDEPQTVRRDHLFHRIARVVDREQVPRVTEFIAEIVGATAESPSALLAGAREDPRAMWEQTRRAWSDWIDGELHAAPILFIVEDLQWADGASLRLLEETLSNRRRPLFAVALGRPEADGKLGRSWADRGLQTLRLQPLGRRASESLAREVLGEDAPVARVEAISQRAAGHAFFLEELLRAEAEGHGHDAPATVVAMLQERIERCEGDARRLLRAASIFGQTFRREGLLALLGANLDGRAIEQWLETLLNREMIVVSETRQSAHEYSYAFRHDLVRDAVYSTLTDEDRARGHLLAAKWLQASGERDAATLAGHFAYGGDSPSAGLWYGRAAELAYERQDYDGAQRYVESALGHVVSDEQRGLLCRMQATMALAQNAFVEAEGHAAAALSLLPVGSPAWYHSATVMVTVAGFGIQNRLGETVGRVLNAGAPPPDLVGMAAIRTWTLCSNMLYFAGQYPLAMEFDRRVADHAELAARNDPCAAAWIHFGRHVRGSYCGGNPETTFLEAARAAENMEQTGDREVLIWIRIEAGKAAALLGDFELARQLLGWSLATAGSMQFAMALAKHRLARVRAWEGATHEALELQRSADELFQAQQLPVFHGVSLNQLALFLSDAGDLDAAARVASDAVDILLAAPPVRVYAWSTAARIATARGRTDDALEYMRTAEAERQMTGLINDGEAPFELASIGALRAAGAFADAGRQARAARERLERAAAGISRPEWRRSFFERVPENASLLRLASLDWREER